MQLFTGKTQVLVVGLTLAILITSFQNCSQSRGPAGVVGEQSQANAPQESTTAASTSSSTGTAPTAPVNALASLSSAELAGYTKVKDASCKNYYENATAPKYTKHTYIRNDHRSTEPLIVAINAGIGGGYNPGNPNLPNIPVYINQDVNVPVTLILFSLTRVQWEIYGNIKQVNQVYTFSEFKPEVLNVDQSKVIYSYGKILNGSIAENDPFATFSIMEQAIRPSAYAPLSTDNVLGNNPDFFNSGKGAESTIFYSEKLFNKTPDITFSYWACNQLIGIMTSYTVWAD